MTKYKWLLPNQKNLFIWVMSVVMLSGIFLFNWRPETIFIAYLFETIVIGFIHIFKLLATFLYSKNAPTDSGRHKKSDIFQIPFFIVHYFFFIFVQSVFIFLYLSFFIKHIKADIGDVLSNYTFLLQQPDILLAVLSMAMANVAMVLKNFFLPKRYEQTNIEKLFIQPYLRIFIQQFVTIITGFGILFFNMPLVLAVLLIVTRLVVDLALQEAARNEKFKKVFVKYLAQSENEKDLKEVEKQVEAFLDP